MKLAIALVVLLSAVCINVRVVDIERLAMMSDMSGMV